MADVIGNITTKKIDKISKFNPKFTNKSKQQKAVRAKGKSKING